MASPEKQESTITSGVSRLVRSLSKNPTKVDKSDQSSSSPSTESTNPNETSSKPNSKARKIPLGKLTAFEKFMQLGKKSEKPDWPPPSWYVGQNGHPNMSETAQAESVPLPPTPATGAETEPTLETKDGEHVQGDANTDHPEGEHEGNAEQSRPPTPVSFARKIQDMIGSLPSYTSTTSLPSTTTTTTPAPDPPTEPTVSTDGPPPMPPPPAPVTDSKLIAYLSSSSIMNGSISKGTQSVWSVLDKLRATPGPAALTQPKKGDEEVEESDEDDDDESVMMYGPLQPNATSQVEIAQSEICTVDEEGDVISERPGEDLNKPAGPAKDDKGKGQAKEEEGAGKGKAKGTGKGKGKAKKTKEVRVWVPSHEKLSLQATWWGYRLYLPPPVLDVLSDSQVEVAKRAAMITTALKWILDHLPVSLLPPQFRPIMMVLKRLSPFLSYIGVFIAWSWSAIKAYDKGQGVVLTATWLLPVALIPSTWDETLPQPVQPSPPSKAAQSEPVPAEADPTTLPGIAKEAGPDAAWAEVEKRAREAAEEDKKAKDGNGNGKAKSEKPTTERKKSFFKKSVKESVKDVDEQNKKGKK